MLKVGSAAESLRSLNDYDYCLMQIQSYDARQDYTSLPFHKKWNEVRAEVSKGDNALAHTLFVQCCQEIANSPDLTPPQAEALIQAYQANYAKVVELYARLRTPPPAQVAQGSIAVWQERRRNEASGIPPRWRKRPASRKRRCRAGRSQRALERAAASRFA